MDTSETITAFPAEQEENAQRLLSLLEIARSLTSTLDLESLLDLILDRLKVVIDYTGSSILVREGDYLVVRAYRGPAAREMAVGARYSMDEPNSRRLLRQEPILMADIQSDHSPYSEEMTEQARTAFSTVLRYAHAYMGLPLFARDQLVGALSLHHSQPGYFTTEHLAIARMFANQAAVAIENARLFAAEQRRAEQFRVITEVGQQITAILDLQELLNQTARLIRDRFGYYHVHIGLVEEGYVTFNSSAGAWYTEATCPCCDGLRLKVGRDGMAGYVTGTGQPLLLSDIQKDTRYIPLIPDQSGSAIGVPLKIKGRVIGVLNVESERCDAFDESDVLVLQTLANQVAVAVENAQLYEQAGTTASLQERQRLARELHDSVSQALYGIALGTRTARTLVDRVETLPELQQALADPLDYTLSLAEAGLAEMRALIFELRPDALSSEGLAAALSRQAEVLRARHGLKVNTRLSEGPDVPLLVKEALYRVAQESLNNTIKHAHASQVDLRLDADGGEVVLELRDDGRGFDPSQSFPGHLGLVSMQERVTMLGGTLAIESAPGRGTAVSVRVPMAATPIA